MCWSAPRWQRHVGAGVQPWLRERNPCVLYCLRPSTTLKQCVRSRKHSGAHAHGPIANCSKPIEAHVLTVHPRSIADLQVDNFFDPCVADAALPPHFASVALHLCHQLPRDKLHLCCNLRRDNVARHAGLCQRRRWRRRGDALANCSARSPTRGPRNLLLLLWVLELYQPSWSFHGYGRATRLEKPLDSGVVHLRGRPLEMPLCVLIPNYEHNS
eukprot:scaffold52984_cov73-Phaeocystis_antarctica.AAC.5